MTTQRKLKTLDSLPDGLASYARSEFYSQHITATDSEVVERLITNNDMDPVWKALTEPGQDEYLPHEFFDLASGLRRQWRNMSGVPDKALEQELKKIANRADQLADLIKLNEREITLHQGVYPSVGLFREAAKRLQLASNGHLPQANGSTAGEEAASVWEDEPIHLDSLLHALADALRRPLCTDIALLRPTKPNATNAERTFLARAVSDFFRTWLGNARYDLVAPTVNTILNSPNDPLDKKYAEVLAGNLD